MAGQVIMQGFVGFTIPLWLRRSLTMLPALLVIWLGLEPTQVLVLSQVVLSFGIPFALIPLLRFTGRAEVVGELKNHRLTRWAGWLAAAIIVGLNGFLLWQLVA